jgi:prepilin peptidase CpaA
MQPMHPIVELLLMLVQDQRVLVLVTLLAMASVTDYMTYRIPNWLTVGGMAFGLIYNTVFPFTLKLGFFWALGGLATGLVVLLPLYALRTMGAGDVKLMAMVGAFLGVTDTLYAIAFSLAAGGIAALGFALFHRVFKRMLVNVRDVAEAAVLSAMGGFRPSVQIEPAASVGKLPYALCISAGTLVYLVSRQLGFV